jgi:hypothetical protein
VSEALTSSPTGSRWATETRMELAGLEPATS